jgi:hypothetical protein
MNMAHVRAGLLTSYGADLTLPAWLYITSRGLDSPSRRTLIGRYVGHTPAFAACLIVLASALTEVSQYFWPHGLFPGVFDPLDILAYVFGVGLCYGLDTMSPRKAPPVSPSE